MILFVVGTLALLIFLAWMTYGTARLLRQVRIEQNLLLMPAENALRLLIILACFILASFSEQPFAAFGWESRNTSSDLLLGASIGIVIALIMPMLTRVAVARFGTQIYSPIVVMSVLPRNAREWFLFPIALAPAVLLEELLFRSLLLGGFAVFAPPLLLAIVWSLIFGAMHLPQGALGIFVAMILGLLLSILFLITGSLLAPFVTHYLINLIQIAWATREKNWLENYDPGSHL